jgi:hypothetical protein
MPHPTRQAYSYCKLLSAGSLLVCAAVASGPSTARAAFVNGVDTFSGVVYDTGTWDVFCANPQPVQNNSLDFVYAPPFGAGRFYTNTITVGSGQSVRTEVTVNSMATNSVGGSADFYLALSAGISVPDNGLLDPNSVDLDGHFAVIPGDITRFLAWEQSSDGSGSGLPFEPSVAPILGQTYQLEIDRLSASAVVFSLYDADGAALETTQRTFANLPPELHISIGSNNLNATFKSVSIGVIPEPACLPELMLIGLACLTRHDRLGATLRGRLKNRTAGAA